MPVGILMLSPGFKLISTGVQISYPAEPPVALFGIVIASYMLSACCRSLTYSSSFAEAFPIPLRIAFERQCSLYLSVKASPPNCFRKSSVHCFLDTFSNLAILSALISGDSFLCSQNILNLYLNLILYL